MNHLDIARDFPRSRYPSMTGNQKQSFTFLNEHNEGVQVIEAPTGTGKTAIGYTWLKSIARSTDGHLFYLVPNKTLVDEVVRQHPDVSPMYGRNEHPCLYYEGKLRADEIPCSLLAECPHRVNQDSGETYVAGATPCPYLLQKYGARSAKKPVVATYAFYLYAAFFGRQFEPAAAVVDEAHGIAKSVRSVLEFRITDWKIDRVIAALEVIESPEVETLQKFRKALTRLAKKREPDTREADAILSFDEISSLIGILEGVDLKKLEGEVAKAAKRGILDPRKEEDRQALKQLEVITKDLRRYIRSFKYSLPPEADERARRRHPLNYAFAFWIKEKSPQGHVQYELVVKSYNVAGLIRAMLPERVLAYSATIADPEVFTCETGIDGDFLKLGSDFPSDRTRIFMPTDTPNLSVKARNRRDKTKALRQIARAAKQFGDKGMRSLVVVVSNEEREKFLMLAREEELDAMSYGNGVSPRESAKAFREGKSTVLVGTVANYGEGVDLPNQIAPAIFLYRPAYPNPNDPQTVFEEGRFGNHRWNLWNWRVMIEMLQVRGRNVRSLRDKGVTFLVSQQFRRFAFGSLPEWLKPAYVGDKTFEDCVQETVKLLS